MLKNLFMRILEQATGQFPYMLQLGNIRVIGGAKKGGSNGVSVWKASKARFLEFVKYTGREKPFLQACRVSALEKQTHMKGLCKQLIRKWEIERESVKLRKGLLNGTASAQVDEAVDPSTFRIAYRGYKAHVIVRNALHLSGGGLFDRLDPYVLLRFRGSKQPPFRTSVLSDSGSDPIWDNEGDMLYNGETALEVSVWDYDRLSADDLIGTGILQVENFCNGFEGMIPLSNPGNKKKKSLKQMTITIGIQWPPLDQNATMTLPLSNNTLGSLRSLTGPAA
mmetsp:Transcript_62878/g.123812  ORF Transcript_62878/g.123812 Transcript_62878/m.123812 type:complete len:280 (+) Transcript_62878:135-974(+)